LKPGNVVISEHDHPKILDFGIALLLAGEEGVPRITQAGMALGSIPYMSPQQLFGGADERSADIYSLGVLLFEMATGKLPFMKARPEALMFAIVNTAAPSARSIRPDIPPALDSLIGECLRKDSSQRPASAGEIANELQRLRDATTSSELRQAPRTAIHSIAVLPLRNVAGDPAQEYFVAGMTEAIIADLSRIKALRVISRTSVMKYKDTSLSLPEVARELNVDAVLEGSALLIGNRVRVNVKLVRARDEETLWADRYDRDVDDVLQLQSDLADTVVREISVQLTPSEADQMAAVPRPVNRTAYDEFLKSRHSSFSGSREAIEIGLKHAKRALEVDPGFALGWAALAECHMMVALRHMAAEPTSMADAARAAERARELDPLLGDAQAMLGIIQFYTGKTREGMKTLEAAIPLNPSYSIAHNILARAKLSFARFDEALAIAQRSVSIDPLMVLNHTTVADTYYFSRQYEKAVLQYKLALEVDPRFDGAHLDLGRAYEALGQFDEAREAINECIRLTGPMASSARFGLAHLEAAAGNERAARRILNEMIDGRESRPISAWGIAALHASLGDVDEAFRWLDIAAREKASGLVMLRVHPRIDPIRSDARYWPLVEKLGLAD
jgi:TolB-like protein